MRITFIAPFRVGELHRGQIVHDSDVNEALGVLHDAEDGLEVLSPASCTQGWRGTLSEMGNRCDAFYVCKELTVKTHLRQVSYGWYHKNIKILQTDRPWTACC